MDNKLKITGYIPLQFYNCDKTKVDTLEKIKEYIFLPSEDWQSSEAFFKADQNRDKLKRIPLYLDKSLAENDATFFTGRATGDYGTVLKVSITIEKEEYNQMVEERDIYHKLIKERPTEGYERPLKEEVNWYFNEEDRKKLLEEMNKR
tara:strand:- start:44 stop:487 length:444 start_codon:yes stop_codon:yes gene_type:complete